MRITYLMRLLGIWCILISIQFGLHAQSDSVVKGDAPVTQIVKRYVIHSVDFVIENAPDAGNLPVESEMLASISSQPTEFGLTTKMIRSLAFESLRNKETPTFIRKWLVELYATSAKNKFKYVDKSVLANDILRLNDLFLQKGYHDAKTRCVFTISADERNNILTFYIAPGRLYTVDTIVVKGVDSVALEVKNEIPIITGSSIDKPFNESDVSAGIGKIFTALHDNGYAYSGMGTQRDTTDTTSHRYVVKTPDVYIDTVRKFDSITVYINPGRRYKIGTIIFIDSTNGNPVVSGRTKMDQVEIHTNDWYSKKLLDNTTSNLMNLGTFDRVFIRDTILKRRVDSNFIETDIINLEIFTQYRRAWEFNLNAFYNSTFPDNFNNAGVEASYLHRNIFGAAQNLTAYFRPTLRNTGGFVSNWLDSSISYAWNNKIYEYEFGLTLFQPDFTRLFGNRINISGNLNISQRFILDPFQLFTISPRVNFTMPLNSSFDRVQFDMSIDWQKPSGYSEAVTKTTQGITDSITKATILETLEQYRILDSNSHGNLIPTLVLMSLSYNLDRTDNVFTPTKGYKLSLLGEYSFLDITSFSRIQGMFSSYKSVSSSTVFALKARVGKIYWRNPESSFIPFERHYFAGGASSIRSYASRSLYYRTPDDTVNTTIQGGLDKYIGYSTIIELSAELRYSLGYYPSLGEFVAGQVSKIGFAGFVDLGNAFNRLTAKHYNDASISDIVDPFKWGWGIGVGLRYATPIGPARLDFGFKAYDPMELENHRRSIFNRVFFESYAIQFSIGHAF